MFRLLVIICTLVVAAPAWAETKFALVIGNNTYKSLTSLETAINDADAMGKALEARGFDVTILKNGSEKDMVRGMHAFKKKLKADSMAVFFYAGHGVEFDGANYLLPTDIDRLNPADKYMVPRSSISLDYVLSVMERAKASLVVLDSCRNDPFEEAVILSRGGKPDATVNRGFVKPPREPAGMFIVYSAGVKQRALDRLTDTDPNKNSVFTRVFLRELEEPGVPIREVIYRTRRKVRKLAASVGHNQFPSIYDQLISDMVLTPGTPVTERMKRINSAFDTALANEDLAELRRLTNTHPAHERSAQAKAMIARLSKRKLGTEIADALKSLKRSALARLKNRVKGHPREGDVMAAITMHREIDTEVAALDLGSLQKRWSSVARPGHPRREDVQMALGRALAKDTCDKLYTYGFDCPPGLAALARGLGEKPIRGGKTKKTTSPAKTDGPKDVKVPKDGSPDATQKKKKSGDVKIARKDPKKDRNEKRSGDPLTRYLYDIDSRSLDKAGEIKFVYLQKSLHALGHYRGRPSGTRDARTTLAIRMWRDALGIRRGGRLSSREKIALIKMGAEKSAEVRARLGAMYALGVGVRHNKSGAQRMLQEAARMGYHPANEILTNLKKHWSR